VNTKIFGLLTSATVAATGGTAITAPYKTFTAHTVGAGTPCSGTIAIQGTIDNSSWATLSSNAFTAASGWAYQFNGPWYGVRSTLGGTITGSFTSKLYASDI